MASSESLESEISLSNPTMDIKEDLIKAAARIVLAVIAVLCVTIFFLWPTKRETARAVITKDRRSVVKYKGAVPAPTLERALTAAIHAPNHFLNEPWRFRVLGPATVAKLVALNEAKREIFEGVPGWLMVSVVPTAGDTLWNPKALEDHAATACAVQNFMLSLGERARAPVLLSRGLLLLLSRAAIVRARSVGVVRLQVDDGRARDPACQDHGGGRRGRGGALHGHRLLRQACGADRLDGGARSEEGPRRAGAHQAALSHLLASRAGCGGRSG